MSISSTENDRRLVEELAKNFSYEVLEDFLLRKKFTIKSEKIYLEDKLIDEYGIKNLQLFATKEVDQQPLHLYTLELTTTLTDRSSKKRQFDIAKRLLNTHLVNTGLFIFHDNLRNFRFSLVYKIPIGTKVKYSYYKRYTFYVSPNLPNKTFILQIGQCEFDTFENIKSTFSVEPVTKQFYGELQAWYYYAMNQAKFPEDYKYSDDPEKDREIRTALNLIRLITRLIFIWFLKEKELIPEILFDEKQLKNIVKDFGNGHNYYNAILQNLFFATLNRPINERGWAYDKGYPANKSNFGVKSLYRYEDKFLIQSNEVMKLFSTIPFINGGLFDCLDKDKVYIDGFSRNEKKQAKINDELFFSSEEKIVDLSKYFDKNAKVKVRGLIDILKSYNFTTDEATPIDQEIALDPELLGKVFENLLASYNPETATTARKATGSYYTPREIVDYMVEESLREYLKTEVPESQDILDDLFSYSVEELDISKDLRLKLIQAIDQIKIIDPACGSGAFPMGILHKLVFLLQKIDPENEMWKEIQLYRACKEEDEVSRTEKDEQERKKLLEEINENFDESINYPDYARKLYLIENCIYGVDIQPIAIQISKLRFFISLILDQKVDRSKPNCGILPLPNLETKFIAANTLIGLEKPAQKSFRNLEISQKSFRNPEIERLEGELKFLRHRYFRIKSRADKIQLQNKDRELREKLKNALIGDGWDNKVAEKIANFDIFDQNASADWFDPEWMFGVVDGFDIIIGNPPYGNILGKDVNKNTKEFVRKNYKYSTISDISSPFLERSFNLLEKQGNLVFIITYAITFNKDFSKTRELLSNNFKKVIIYTFDRDRCRIFQSMTQSVSILKCFNKGAENKEGIYSSRMFRETPNIYEIEVTNCNKFLLPKGVGYRQEHRLPKIGEKINKQILEKLFQFEHSVKNIINQGDYKIWIRTTGNYWYNAFDRKPYQGYAISSISVIKEFSNFLILIINSSLFYFWFRIYGDGHNMNLDILESFPLPEKEKILRYNILLDKMKERFMEKLFSVFDKEHNRFLTSRIKSEIDLIDLVLGKYLYKLEYEEIIHILNYDFEVRSGCKLDKPFYNLIEQIISSKKQNPKADTSELEKEIDKLVYELYNLTEEEIKIIEGRYNG